MGEGGEGPDLGANAILAGDSQAFWPEPKIPATPLITTFRLLPEMALPLTASMTK